jgi:transcriptional regulator with XRE-family HTH domain
MKIKGELIKNLRFSCGLSQAALAKAAKITQAYISKIERGDRVPPYDTLEAISNALQTPITSLIEGQYALDSQKSENLGDFLLSSNDTIALPVLRIEKINCDGESYHLQDHSIESYICISKHILETYDETNKPFIVRVEDNSMAGAMIPGGAKAIVNPAAAIRDGNPVLVCFGADHRIAIKWYYRDRDGSTRIRSSDQKFGDRTFTDEDIKGGFFFIIGRVVKIILTPIDG